jgi:hypothetical protein
MMKGLFEAECAGQNPLVKLTSQFTGTANEQKLTMDAIKGLKQHFDPIAQHHHQHQHQQMQQHSAELNADEFVQEYLRRDANANAAGPVLAAIGTKRMPAPRSFHMEALLNELKHIDNSVATLDQQPQGVHTQTHGEHQQLQQAKSLSSGDWAQEYWSSLSAAFQKQPSFIANVADMDEKALGFKWSTDYLTQNEATIFDEAWENLLMRNALSPSLTASGALLPTGAITETIANSSNNSSNTTATATATTNQLNDEMLKTANELLDSMQDSRFSETEVS